MKYVALLGILFSLVFYTQVSAAYPLAMSVTDTVITATLSGAKGSTSTFQLLVSTSKTALDGTYTQNPIEQRTYSVTDTGVRTATVNAEGVAVFTLVGTPQTTYYIRIVETPYSLSMIPVKSFYTTDKKIVTTKAATIIPSELTTIFTEKDGTILLQGQFTTNTNPGLIRYENRIQYSKNPITASDPFYKVYKSDKISDTTEGIADDGKYHLLLTNIVPSTKYYIRETTTYGGTKKVTDGTFTSTSGYKPSTAENIQDDFESRSYRLLAPLPGFTLFLDPDLCAEQVEQGKKGQLCDINDMLNLGFQILIGLAAVLLVLRIMFEGYTYITTDIPKLKINAKAGLMDAVLGLLLALSAFLILNTINPKLVENSIDVGALQIGVTLTEIDATTFKKLTGETLKTKSEYIPIVEKIASEKGVDSCVVKATIQIESQWKASAIGCDENVPRSDVASRMAFIKSGIKYDATTFIPTSEAGSALKNNCSFDKNKASSGYGLDWRFSKGGGLMQVTIFPSRYKSDAWYNGVKEGGTYWINRMKPSPGWEKLLGTTENITRGTQLLKEALADCGGNVQQAFRQYQGGKCSSTSSTIDATVAEKMALYNSCKAGQ